MGSPSEMMEVAALREELRQTKTHLTSWHESWKQAKQACDAWKREADEANNRTRMERESAAQRIEEVGGWVCVGVGVCVCGCVCGCVWVCVCGGGVCVCGGACVCGGVCGCVCLKLSHGLMRKCVHTIMISLPPA